MISLKSARGRKALSSLVGHRLLLTFDFDGTLAAIAPHPDAVSFDPNIEHLLTRLDEYASIAIVTGRSREDLLRFFHSPPRTIIGNHGAEGTSEHAALQHARATCTAWRLSLDSLLETESPDGRAWLEDKTYSLTIHCRVPILLRRIQSLLEQPLPLPQIRVVSGKASINLLPAGMPTKADAVRSLLRRLRCDRVLYVGDDVTDEDVFSIGDTRIIGVHVGKNSTSKADFFLSSQKEVPWLLKKLFTLLVSRKSSLTKRLLRGERQQISLPSSRGSKATRTRASSKKKSRQSGIRRTRPVGARR